MNTIILSILILIILVVFILDFITIFITWQSRIHIGRHTDRFQWKNNVYKVSRKWLNNTPKIKVTDNTRLTIIDRLKGNYSNPSIQYWQEAALLLGISENRYEDSCNSRSEVQKFLDSKFNEEGQWNEKPKEIDCAILAYAVLKAAVGYETMYKAALDYTWDLIQDTMGDDETVLYRKYVKNYRYVDTIGMICPFLVKYGVIYNKPECIELAVSQIFRYKELGVDEKSNIPFHAYDVTKDYKVGLCGWGRGLGWFALGIIDTWIELPNESEYKKDLQKIIEELTRVIINIQDNDGGFGWIVTMSDSRKDSSTTAVLLWFLINASRIDGLQGICNISIERAIKYLMSVTRRNGVIDFSQGDTKGIGVYSMLFDKMPFTQGMALRSIALYLKGDLHE